MTQQYLRQLSLVVANSTGNGYDFGEFWVTFSVRRGDNQTPNSLDARIYNMKPATANIIASKEFSRVSLTAGYQGNSAVIFDGTILQFRQGRVNQMDSYVDLTAAEGDVAYNYAPVFTPLPAGSSQSQIANMFQSVLARHGITGEVQASAEFQGTCIRGKTFCGMARDELREFAWNNNVKWSIQGNQLTFTPYTGYIGGGSVPLISVATGLIGVPEQTQQGINIRILLNPRIKVSQLIKLDSQINQFRIGLDYPSQLNNPQLESQNVLNQQGAYYVMCANHTGDTRGESWYTDLTCLAVNASVQNVQTTNPVFATSNVIPTPINRYGQY